MFTPDVSRACSVRFFRAISKDALSAVAQRHIDAGGNRFFSVSAGSYVALGPSPCLVREKTCHQLSVFSHQTQEQMLWHNLRRPEQAGLIARKEYCPPRLLCKSLKQLHAPNAIGYPALLRARIPSLGALLLFPLCLDVSVVQ